MEDKIEITYKGARISFDTREEEWVAKLNIGYSSGEDVFKKHKSLQKLKDSIDRFNKKEFKEIPILLFKEYDGGAMVNADIISFTETKGECWIRYHDGNRERINVSMSSKKIYACGNVINEPILNDITRVCNEIKAAERELVQKKKERIHLVDSLQKFDIGGYAEEPLVEL